MCTLISRTLTVVCGGWVWSWRIFPPRCHSCPAHNRWLPQTSLSYMCKFNGLVVMYSKWLEPWMKRVSHYMAWVFCCILSSSIIISVTCLQAVPLRSTAPTWMQNEEPTGVLCDFTVASLQNEHASSCESRHMSQWNGCCDMSINGGACSGSTTLIWMG